MVSEMESVNTKQATAVINNSSNTIETTVSNNNGTVGGNGAYLANNNNNNNPNNNNIQSQQPSPQTVGLEFVRQYYTMLSKAPQMLFRFYNEDSVFVHGCFDKPGESRQYVIGQKMINAKITSLNYKNCHTKIRQIDSMETINNGLVIQVNGELSNNGLPLRPFNQTFVLANLTTNKYYVRNDIFRYQDEFCSEEVNNVVEESNVEETIENNIKVSESVAEVNENRDETPESVIVGSGGGGIREDDYIVVGASYQTNGVLETEANLNNNQQSEESNENVDPEISDEKNEELEAESLEPISSSLEGPVLNNNNEPKTYAKMVSRNFQGTSTVPATVPATRAVTTTATINNQPSEAPSNLHVESLPPTPNNFPSNSAKNSSFTGVALVSQPNQQPQPSQRNVLESRVVPKKTVPSFGGGGGRRNDSVREARNEGETNEISGNNGPVSLGGGGDHFFSNSIQKKYPDENQLFIGNLLPNFSEDDLHKVFSKFGKIVDVRINRQTHKLVNNKSKNFGFIIFENPEIVDQIIAQKPIFHEGHRYNVEKKHGKSSTGSGGGATYNRGGNIRTLSNVPMGARHNNLSVSNSFGQSNQFGSNLGGFRGGGGQQQTGRPGGQNYQQSQNQQHAYNNNNSTMSSNNNRNMPGGGGQNFNNANINNRGNAANLNR